MGNNYEILTTRTQGVKAKSLLALFALALVLLSSHAQEAASPEDRRTTRSPAASSKADQVRFPTEGFQVDINITSTQPGQANELRKYRVLSKGNSNTVVMLTEPAAERGQIILMKGRNCGCSCPTSRSRYASRWRSD